MLYLLSTSCVLTLASSLLFPLGYATAAQFLPTRGSSLSISRTTRTSRCSSPSRRPCGALLQLRRVFFVFLYFASAVSDIFVINVINNIRTDFIISFYVICAVIYCSFCCIYVWLDPGTYMIARFMSFYKPGVTRRPCGGQLPRGFVYVLCFRILRIRHFVINVINNIRIRFIISFYIICAVIYCSFCCIYVWLDPGTYMIARFMSFYKQGVTEWYQSYIDYRTKA